MGWGPPSSPCCSGSLMLEGGLDQESSRRGEGGRGREEGRRWEVMVRGRRE